MGQSFMETCRQIVPVFREEKRVVATSLGADTLQCMATLPIQGENDILPRKSPVMEFAESIPMVERRRAILVTDDEKAAMKAALLLAEEQYEEEDWEYDEDEWDDCFEDEYSEGDCCEEETDKRYAILDIRKYPEDEKMIMSAFLLAEKYWNESREVSSALFLGIDALQNKKSFIEAVAGCLKQKVFLHIPRKLESDVDVQKLVYEHNFKFLHLPENDDSYYEDFLQALLSRSSYKMYPGFDSRVFLKKCRQKWQSEYSEDRIAVALDHAAKNAQKEHRAEILARDFEPMVYLEKKDAYEELMGKTGMGHLKEICNKFIALEAEKKRNPELDIRRKHMLFYGKPGTGKTTGAAMLARIMAEKGIGNGKFVTAARKDLIGSYVGHTAPRVAAMFEEARGGILFVDEAGFFLQENTGGYVKEALKEFIRYMEVYDDVTVIFSMYPKEMQQFLQLDEGMTSRIAHIVKFEDYSLSQLAVITREMLEKSGYHMPKGYEKPLEEYFEQLKNGRKETFGNARESRKIVGELVLEICMRNSQRQVKNPNNLTMSELEKVLRSAGEIELSPKKRIGFQVVQNSNIPQNAFC